MKAGARILIVEDDPAIARLLQLELTHRRFVVEVLGDGLAALDMVEEFSSEVIILDILLPGMDGERLLHQLRRRGIGTPVMMLTARDGQRDKVRALDLGADDYLTKPFDIEELLARLRAMLRRVTPHEVLRIADLSIDTATREVRRGAMRIELTAREFELLEYLAQNARRVLTRDLLLDRVWRETPDADPNVVDVYIGYLRRKVDLPELPRLIKTVRGVGFTLRED